MTDQKSADSYTARVTLRDGKTMPWLGLGLWETPPEQTADVVRQAIKLGYQAVDTARLYKNEAGVGDGLVYIWFIFGL